MNAKSIFSLDLRSLAVARVGLGTLLLVDLCIRFTDLSAHYTDFGILPRSAYLLDFANKWHPSFHLMSGLGFWLAALFVLHLLISVSLIIGYRTRFASIGAWVLLISLQNRNTMILNGGDVLLRQLLFWGMFLPWGHRWSVDRAMDQAMDQDKSQPGTNDKSPKSASSRHPTTSYGKAPEAFFGAASIAWMGQLFLVYWTTLALKTGVEWWPEGTASYYALSLDQFTTTFGQWLKQFPALLQASTYAVILVELLAPLLLICPLFFTGTRMIGLAVLIGLHLSIDMTMHIGLFPWIDIFALLALVPAGVWNRLEDLTNDTALSIVIFYDQDCGFCRRMAYLIREVLVLQSASVHPAQEDQKAAAAFEKDYSWVLRSADGIQYTRFAAFLILLQSSPLTSWLMRPRLCQAILQSRLLGIGDGIYNWVARNRGIFGRWTTPWLVIKPLKGITPTRTTNLVVGSLLLLVVYWNVQGLPQTSLPMPGLIHSLGQTLRLDQKWNMFAPYPTKDDGYYVIEGKLVNGQPFDLMREVAAEPNFDKPSSVAATYPNARWRKYMMNIWQKRHKAHRLYFGKYLCRRHNRLNSDGQRLSTFSIHFMLEKTPPPGQAVQLEKVTIWRHDCLKSTSR